MKFTEIFTFLKENKVYAEARARVADLLATKKEELKKFYPSMEIGELEETVNGADLTDAVDLYVRMGKDSAQAAAAQQQPLRDMRPGRRPY